MCRSFFVVKSHKNYCFFIIKPDIIMVKIHKNISNTNAYLSDTSEVLSLLYSLI